MSLADVPTPEEEAAWQALSFDERVLRISLVKIRSRAICHLTLAITAPDGHPLPLAKSYRGTLGDVLTEALVELEQIAPAP